nr:hypothetical protein [Tanacetum cinerariifolium]
MTEWSVIDNDLSLRYSIIDLLDEDKNVCKVLYDRTADKFAELCNQLGLCNLRDDGMCNKRNENDSPSLLFDESVGKYNYYAFESFEDNLTTFIKKHERDHLPHSDTILYGVENDFKHAGPLATDLIMKLANSSFTLGMVLRHVLFWDPARCLYFLRDLSDRIVLGEYGDIDYESKKAFGTSWRKNTRLFEAWFKVMENESDSQKKDKSKTRQEFGSLMASNLNYQNEVGRPILVHPLDTIVNDTKRSNFRTNRIFPFDDDVENERVDQPILDQRFVKSVSSYFQQKEINIMDQLT